MKKGIQFGLALVIGLPLQSLAKAGIATDGLQFILAIAGILLLVAALMKGTDYLMKNGRRLIHQAVVLARRIVLAFRRREQDMATAGRME